MYSSECDATRTLKWTADATFVCFAPCIKEELRVEWETYAVAHQDHNETAFASEQISKAEQDRSFGKEPFEYEGLALELIWFH